MPRFKVVQHICIAAILAVAGCSQLQQFMILPVLLQAGAVQFDVWVRKGSGFEGIWDGFPDQGYLSLAPYFVTIIEADTPFIQKLSYSLINKEAAHKVVQEWEGAGKVVEVVYKGGE